MTCGLFFHHISHVGDSQPWCNNRVPTCFHMFPIRKDPPSGLKTGAVGIVFNKFIKTSHGCTDEDPKKPIVSALLDLFSGPKCDVVNYYGLQQLAALEATLKSINAEFQPDHIEIKLQVLDSCSSAKGARLATLKALVAAEQTCIQTPLFLGILGNEKKESFQESYGITKVFNIAHVLPYAFETEFKNMDNVHYISSYPVRQHTQGMKLLLMKLGIRRVTIVYENSSTAKMKADHITEKLHEHFCFNRIINFVDTDNFKRQLGTGLKEDGLVVIFDDISTLYKLSASLSSYEKQIILSVGKLGIYNPYFSIRKDVYILQMISMTPLGNLTDYYDADMKKKYDEQRLKKCLEKSDGLERICTSLMIQAESLHEKDWTVDLLQYALILYASSVRIAAFKTCRLLEGSRGICQELHSLPREEWNVLVKESSVLSKPQPASIHDKIAYNMNILAKFNVYLSESSGITRVGTIENNFIHVYNGYSFPIVKPFLGQVSCNETESIVETVPPPTVSYPVEPTLVQLENFFNFSNINMGDYEMIGFLAGIACGILILICAVFYGVYRTVRVKSNRSDVSRGSIRTTNSI